MLLAAGIDTLYSGAWQEILTLYLRDCLVASPWRHGPRSNPVFIFKKILGNPDLSLYIRAEGNRLDVRGLHPDARKQAHLGVRDEYPEDVHG